MQTSRKAISIIGFILWIILVAYVCYRAYVLSLTHDEVGTSNLLFESVRDIMFHRNCFQSANNHILNSLLMKLSVAMFGQWAWAMRLPNMLAFILFYWSLFFLLRLLIRTPWIFLLALIAMSTNLYLLDFFSLCRGYGIALAFQMSSIYLFVRYLYNDSWKSLSLSFISAAFAAYANFTWFNYFAALFACLVFYLLYRRRSDTIPIHYILKALFLPLVIFLAVYSLSATPLAYLKQMNEFRWGANDWFSFLSTFCSNLIYQTHTGWTFVMEVLVLLSFTVTVIAYLKWYGFTSIHKAYLFLILIILIIVIETIIQRNLLDMLYMDGRKAIMYVPLFTLLLFVFIQRFYESYKLPAYIVGAVLTFFILFNLKSMNLQSTREWYYDVNSKKIAYRLKSELQKGKTIGAYWWYHPSISYYTKYELKQDVGQIIRIEDSATEYNQDYLYLNPEHSPSSNYELISVDGVGNSLWRRLR